MQPQTRQPIAICLNPQTGAIEISHGVLIDYVFMAFAANAAEAQILLDKTGLATYDAQAQCWHIGIVRRARSATARNAAVLTFSRLLNLIINTGETKHVH